MRTGSGGSGRLWATRIAAAALLIAAGIKTAGVWLNLSPSMPVGLYLSRQITDGRVPLQRGMIVAVCLPKPLAAWGRVRGYLIRGRCQDGVAPVGKPIFALAGDTVVVALTGLSRNREVVPSTRALVRDREGRALPRLAPGMYPVADGELWLVSTHTVLSWDSRYYGPVPAANIVAVLRPLWTASSDGADP